jgi:uncharacterized protein
MRRNDKGIADRRAIDTIIDAAVVCRLGLIDGAEPYVIPVCFGYDGQSLYFHGASTGRKMSLLAARPRVCLEFDAFTGIVEGDAACALTARYRSVIGWGVAEVLDDPEEKRRGLALVLARYSDREPAFPDDALEGTAVVRVPIDSITGKHSHWEDDG